MKISRDDVGISSSGPIFTEPKYAPSVRGFLQQQRSGTCFRSKRSTPSRITTLERMDMFFALFPVLRNSSFLQFSCKQNINLLFG